MSRGRTEAPERTRGGRPRPRRVVWLDGRVVAAARARISVFDRGLLYGDAAFETVRIYRGRLFKWREHRRRLASTLDRLAIAFPRIDLEAAILDVVAAARLTEAAVRLTITRGVGEGLAPPEGLEPTVLLIPRPIPVGLDDARTDGVAVIRLPFGQGRSGFTSGHKTTDYAAAVQGRLLAGQAGAFEALYVESDGALSEATTSNIFLVRNKRLLTPPLAAGCLPGITRELVFRLAQKAGISVRETPLATEDLGRADELFLTGTVIEIVPVTRVDDIELGPPGTITRQLQQAYRQLIQTTRRRSTARRIL